MTEITVEILILSLSKDQDFGPWRATRRPPGCYEPNTTQLASKLEVATPARPRVSPVLSWTTAWPR